MNRRRSRSPRRKSRSPRDYGDDFQNTAGSAGSRQRVSINERYNDRDRRNSDQYGGGRERADQDRPKRRRATSPQHQMPWNGQFGAFGMPAAMAGAWQQQFKADKKKKKKKRAASSSSSSSSSSDDNWQQRLAQSWQGQMGMWPGMQAAWGWPGMPGPSGMPGAHGMPTMPTPPGWPAQMQPPCAGGDEALALPGARRPGSSHVDPDDAFAASAAFVSEVGQETSQNKDDPPTDVPIFLEPAIEEFVPVPKALLGKVIGKQAQTIIEIREKSGAFKVDARDQTTDPCQVKIAGTKEAVRKARELIMEMVESTRNKHAGSSFVEIPRAKIGMVIGLRGAQVNEIQNQTNTKIDVDFENDPCKCYIKGQPENTERAKQVLLTIAMQIEDTSSEYIDLPRATSGALIGSQGTRIREFQEQSGARIDVDKTGPRCRVRLAGTMEQIATAKQLIFAEVEKNAPINKPAMSLPAPAQPMVIPAHQPASFPATLSESIARAKAAAEAVKNGLVTSAPSAQDSWGSEFGTSYPVTVPPPAAPSSSWISSEAYRPW